MEHEPAEPAIILTVTFDKVTNIPFDVILTDTFDMFDFIQQACLNGKHVTVLDIKYKLSMRRQKG